MNTSRLAFVFPGQGSQSLGMLADIAEAFPSVKTIFNSASDVLHYDLWKLTQTGPKDQLDQTEFTQPAILTASYAIWTILSQETHLPAQIQLAGHSLGEFSALVCAQALNFADAVKLVAARGRYMQAAVAAGEGAMAAIIGLEDSAIEAICSQAKQQEVLAPANYNSPGQVVIAGHTQAVLRAMALAKEQGAKLVTQIPVSVPSHCELMTQAAIALQADLLKMPIHVPELKVINNVAVQAYETVDQIREGLVKQLCEPVRWVEIIQKWVQQGITSMIECGPGKVLTGLNKRIDKSLQLYASFDLVNLENLITYLNQREKV